MLQSLIVGFGRAGKDLHFCCLQKVRRLCDEGIFGETVGVVDPRIRDAPSTDEVTLRLFYDVKEVRGFDPPSTVVHICTPPHDHLKRIHQLAEMGYTNFIVEKPLVTSMSEADALLRLQDRWQLDLCVVTAWLTSALTLWLKDLLISYRFGSPRQLRIVQNKPRFSRTLQDAGHTTAFDVELPHQVVLALYLGGQDVEVLDATYKDMQVATAIVPFMGMAHMTLKHATGLTSYLLSDLTAPARQRSVHMTFEEYVIEGTFPLSSAMAFSQVTVYDREHRVVETRSFEDDPLTVFLQECYKYYAGNGVKPASDLPLNLSAISVLSRAKALSGITD